MSKRRWLLLIALVAGAMAIGTAVLASGSLAPGDYQITIPGVGEIHLSVDDTGTAEVVTVPADFTVAEKSAEHDDDDELSVRLLDAAGLAVVKLEIEDDEIKVKYRGDVEPGTYPLALPNGVTVKVTVGADGSLSVDEGNLPEGTKVRFESDHHDDDEDFDDEVEVKIVFPDGFEVKVQVEDGEFTIKVEYEPDDVNKVRDDDDDDRDHDDDHDDDDDHDEDHDDDHDGDHDREHRDHDDD